ncbi:hypothetical protein DRN85_05680 [Methanosarcinales archaeon]|mgnify:CR=1 FL=1|nr:MAG: hypothetical protein DRN85_05680 [Methanosarcinales archaeon]
MVFKRFRAFVVCLVLFLVFCTPLVGAVSLEVHSKGVNLGRGWFDDDQDYWNQSTNEFNVFTVTEQADDGYDYVALFCPQAYINEGTGLVRIAKVDNSSYDIQDACVAADGRLWVAMDTGLYRSRSNWGTSVRWVNDTDDFMKIMSGDCVRLRYDGDNVYVGEQSGSWTYVHEVPYTTCSPILRVSDDGSDVWRLGDFYLYDGKIYYLWTDVKSAGYAYCEIKDEDTNQVCTNLPADDTSNSGALHINDSGYLYYSQDNRHNIVDPSSCSVVGQYLSSSYDLNHRKGGVVFGMYNLIGLVSYTDGGVDYISTFSTDFNQPDYTANPFTEDANITGIIYSPHEQYYKNQDFTIAYRIAYHFTEWFASAVGGYESGVEADAYSDLMSRYRFSIELSYNGTQIGTYTCPTDQGSWSGENYNETCGFGGVFDCKNTIDLIQRKYLTFTPSGELWEDSGTYTAQLLITNKTTLEQFTLASDTFTVLNQSYNESTGYLPPEEEIPDDAGEPEAIYNNIIYFMTLPIFWGLILYVGFIGSIARAGVSGAAIGLIAFLLLQLFAVVGLFAPYTIYILVVSWVGAGMFFMIGRKMISSGGGEY